MPSLAILLLASSCVPPAAATADLAARRALPAPLLAAAPPPAYRHWLLPAVLLQDGAIPSPFVDSARSDEDARRSLDCLTAAVYYEARSEPLDGQRAVAQVVLNRVRNPAFPNSVCGVVFQGSDRVTGCQFTFTCDGSMLYRREPAAWERSREVAQGALAGDVQPSVGLATNYHAASILPWWAASLTRVAAIGSQIFYRLAGGLGASPMGAQRYSGVEPEPVPMLTPAGMTLGAAGAPMLDAAGDGQSVAVHRGDDDAAATLVPPSSAPIQPALVQPALAQPAPAQRAPVQFTQGVRVHSGSQLDDAGDETTPAMVTIHRPPPEGSPG